MLSTEHHFHCKFLCYIFIVRFIALISAVLIVIIIVVVTQTTFPFLEVKVAPKRPNDLAFNIDVEHIWQLLMFLFCFYSFARCLALLRLMQHAYGLFDINRGIRGLVFALGQDFSLLLNPFLVLLFFSVAVTML